MQLAGKCSWFGGPQDTGVAPNEGLAFIYNVSDQPDLFLPSQPPGTSGLARRLDPEEYYIACRWDYNVTPRNMLLTHTALVRSKKTGREFECLPSDWGPHKDTGRIADISPGLMEALGIQTDDEVEVTFPYRKVEVTPVTYRSIVISSGHGKYVRGASGIIDEVDEARKVVEAMAGELRNRNVTVKTFHDDTSRDQSTNLKTIVDYHNAQSRELDISVHFNAYEQVDKPMGTECLYVTQSALAGQVASTVAAQGFINRGAKKRTDLYFLNNTSKPAILIEVCFVDSTADCDIYKKNFDAICDALATLLGGAEEGVEPTPPPEPEAGARVEMEVSGKVTVVVNGQEVFSSG